MFNEFNLSDEEIIKIIKDYKPLIINASIINGGYDEDLAQEIKIEIYKNLRRNRKIYSRGILEYICKFTR